jgi:formylglycine-generating enzyme required for sulfatase activity
MRSNNCILTVCLLTLLSSCMGKMVGSGASTANGGEVIGERVTAWSEPTPYGMVLVKRGSIKMGPDEQDSLWGTKIPSKEISVESFWMDEKEVTVAECATPSYVSVSPTPLTEATRRTR